MAIPFSKLIKETTKTTLKEAIAPKAVKKPARTLAKDVPEGKAFEEVRVADIKKEKSDTFVKQQKLQSQIGSFEPSINRPIDELAKLNERKRNLYLKANDLKIEQGLTETYQGLKAGGDTPYLALKNMTSETSGVGRTFSTPNGRAKVLYNQLNKNLFELKDSLRTKWAGLSRNQELADDVVRALKDGNTRNAEATKLANLWKEAAEKAKALRNKAGGKIGTLEDWVMPQSHPKEPIRKIGKDKWKQLIKSKLDINRVETEQNAKIDDILEGAYKNITSRKVEKTPGKKALAKQQEFERILHFKDGDSIITYNKALGNDDIFAIMDGHLRRQSKEVALLQLFGSKPDETFERLLELGRNDDMGTFINGEDSLQKIWNVTNETVDESNAVSKVDATFQASSEGFRSLAISSKLGTATISSLADLSTIIAGSGYRGLNSITIMGKGIQTMLQEAVSGTSTSINHELANRLGISSEFANATLSNAKYAEQQGAGWLAKRAENVIRASGLGAWTDGLRTGFGLDLSASIFDNFSKKLDDVNFKDMLKEYGIEAKEWDIIRKTKAKNLNVDKFNGKYLDIDAVMEADEAVGYKLAEMMAQEMDAFIIAPNARVRAWATQGQRRGTLGGETARNMMLFRSFPTSIMMLHYNRWQKLGGGGKVAYAAGTTLSGVVTGGISLWAYDIVTGSTPRDPMRKEFVAESILKAGALGVFADFVSNTAENRYGKSFSVTLAGVPASMIDDIMKTAGEAMNAKKSTFANAFSRAKSYIPGQNLWYTRLLFQKAFTETVQEAIDPNFNKKKRKWEKELRKRGQKPIFR